VTRRRALALAALAIAVVVIWIAVAQSGSDEDAPAPDRPTRLLDLRPADIVSVDVGDHPLPPDELDNLRPELAPLLAIRTLHDRKSAYGLDPPTLVVTVHTTGRSYEVLVGAYNFDRTAVYAAVGDRTGTILPTLAERLASAAGVAIP
jgi:hypothetical protein